MEIEFIQTGDAARILELSDERVRQLEAEGKLSALRTPRGVRLFLRSDVVRLQRERERLHEKEAAK